MPQQTHDPFAVPRNELGNPHPDGVRILQDTLIAADRQKRLTMLNKQRQKDMSDETSKLLELANKLKVETDPIAPEKLSMEQVLQAEQIEKLAKQVREKMKASFAD